MKTRAFAEQREPPERGNILDSEKGRALARMPPFLLIVRMNLGKVVGVFGTKRGVGQFCDNKALVVCGSEAALRKAMLSRGADPATMMIQKARMGDIAEALRAGAAYAFDQEAYARFAPEAEKIGIPKQDFDFTPSQPGLIKFLILEPKSVRG